MAVLTHLETDTGTNVDISAATAVGAYTANADKLIMVDVSIDAVAGDGDYVMYITRQIGGSGSAYRILPQTTMTAASGLTAISGQSGWITVRNGDVLTCYVDGLAGDTSTPDWSTRWFESAVTLVTLADDAITAAKFDESTAYPLKSADTGSTQVARVGADSDTLETLSDQLDSTALEATLTAIKGAGWTNETLVALKAYVDEIESRLTAARAGYLDKLNVSGTLAHSNDAATYKADVSGIPAAVWGYATRTLSSFGSLIADIWSHVTRTLSSFGFTVATNSDANVTAIKAKTDNLPANTATALAAIQSDLDNHAQYKADVSGLATTAHVQEVENKIDAIDITVNTIPTNPLLDTAYTAPDNAGIAAIQEKTEQLTFTAPNKVDASADVVLSPEAIENMASAIGEGLTEEIWSSSVRTLTQSPAEVIATVLGTGITQIRGNSWAVQLTGVVLESTQQFAIKYNATQPDSAALLFVDSVNGLTVLNGVAQDGEDSSKASLTYDGTILTLTVDASITAQLPVGGWQYGIQSVSDNGIVAEPYGGSFRVLADVVRATD